MSFSDDEKTMRKDFEDERIESLERQPTAVDEEADSIEATAASKAAWLISITVSIGGFLFGTSIPSNISLSD